MPTVQVERLGHVNVYAADHERVQGYQVRVLGGRPFREWEEPASGGRNALVRIAGTVVENFSPTRPDGAIGRWLARHGSGWHSLEWTVPSLDEALATLRARGIRITEHVEGAYAFTHPRDCHGISIELTERRFPGDLRDRAGWSPPARGEENPLRIAGPVGIAVASRDPGTAATWLADLTGAVDVRTGRPGGPDAGSVSVAFPDHVIEFRAPVMHSAGDPLADFLRVKGERIFAVSFPVADLAAARAALSGSARRFDQAGSLLVLPADDTGGGRIELRAAG
jgi:hypothetical protein